MQRTVQILSFKQLTAFGDTVQALRFSISAPNGRIEKDHGVREKRKKVFNSLLGPMLISIIQLGTAQTIMLEECSVRLQ